MAGEMRLFFKDLYPNMGVQETSTEAIPEPDDQDSLGEDATKAEHTSIKSASKFNILIAVILVICLIVFFGVAN